MSGYQFQSLLGSDSLDADAIVVDELDATTVHISKYLYVDAPGTAIINQIIIPTGAQNGYVLTSDAIGDATWKPQSVPTLVGDASGSVGANQVNTLANGTIPVNTLVTLNGIQTITNKVFSNGAFTGSFNGNLTGNASTATSATTAGSVTMGSEVIGNSATCTLLNSAVIAKVLTGYVSGTGTITAADTILSAIQKLNGNTAAPAVGGQLSGTIANATLVNSAVIAKVLTGYVSGAGTITAADTILTAIQKLNGNAPLVGVSTATASRLALRDASAGCAFAALTATTINANGNISLAGTSPCLQANSTNATLAGYCSAAAAYFTDSIISDIAYRNIGGSLRFGTNSGNSQLAITSTGVNVNGNLFVTGSQGAINCNAIIGAGNLTWSGVSSSVASNITNRGFDVLVPTTINNVTIFTKITDTNGSSVVKLDIQLSDASVSESYTYNYNMSWGSTGSAWLRLIPDKFSGLNGLGSRTIAIDVLSTTTDTSFRVARVSGALASTCKMNMTIIGNVNTISLLNTFTTSAQPVPPNFNQIESYTSAIQWGAGTGVAMTNGVTRNITQITVPPGLWTITASVGSNASAAVMSFVMGGVSTTSATLPSDNSWTTIYGGSVIQYWNNAITTFYVDVSVSTIYYLVNSCNFTSGTVTGSGRITAIRTR